MLLVASLLVALSRAALELTLDTYEEAIAGKGAFIKFLAPWCGHCKKMKPDWDKLSDEFDGNGKVVVADVDCTAKGESLCKKFDVKGYPTIKYFMVDDSEGTSYDGGRTFPDLKKFVETTYKAGCKIGTLVNCSPAQKEGIEKWKPQGLGPVQDELMRIDNELAVLKEKKQKLASEGKEEIKTFKTKEGKLASKVALMNKVYEFALRSEEL